MPVYLVDQPAYFDREELYREGGEDYKDNCERFVFFCRSVMEGIRLLELEVDLIHANDWQTGLIPAFQRIEYENAPGYEQIATLLTIHNLAYQGQFWHWDMLLTGLDWKYFNWHQMEFYGQLNLLKTGIVFADSINTVSPRYAEEIQQRAAGVRPGKRPAPPPRRAFGNHQRCRLRHLESGDGSLSAGPLPIGGLADRQVALQGRTATASSICPPIHKQPLVGIIGRLAEQKGFDLVAQIIKHWVVSTDVQWAVLGTGEPQYHELLQTLSAEHPDKVAVRLEFSDRWAHLIEAGADMFLMPSRYEPCGLNQLYSLKYGTVPIVHATGGLADTIVDATAENLAAGRANGFSFDVYEAAALEKVLERRLSTPFAMTAGSGTNWSRPV